MSDFESTWRQIAIYKVKPPDIAKLNLSVEDRKLLEYGFPSDGDGFDFSVVQQGLKPAAEFLPLQSGTKFSTALILARTGTPSEFLCIVPEDGFIHLTSTLQGASFVNSSFSQFVQSFFVYREYCQGPTYYSAREISQCHKRLKILLAEIDKAALKAANSYWSGVLQMIKDGVI